MKKEFKDFLKKDFLILVIGGIIINGLALLLDCCVVKAATTNKPLPYLVEDNLYYSFETYKQAYDTAWASMYPIDWTHERILFWTVDSSETFGLTYMAYPVFEDSEYTITLDNNQVYDNFDCATNSLHIRFEGGEPKWWIISFRENRTNDTVVAYGWNQTYYWRFFGDPTEYPNYLSGGKYEMRVGLENKSVLISSYESGELVPVPDPVPIPDKPENPDIDDYLPTPTNPPPIDTTSPRSVLESIWGLVLWGFNLIKGYLVGIGKYIVDSIGYFFNTLFQNLYTFFKNIFDNLKNFFKPFFEKVENTLISILDTINHFFEPFDFQTAQTHINNSVTITSIRNIITNISTFTSIFTNTNEPENLSFTLDFSNNSFVNFGLCYLDFNFIKPFRSAIRLFIGCLLVLGLLVTIATSINNYIGGNSAKNESE